MRLALLSILIIMPLFALLGTMVVNGHLSFFSDALGHSAYTGIAIGVLISAVNMSWPMIAFAVLFALLLNLIRHKNPENADTIISIFSSLGMAAGLVILSKNGSFSRYSAYLVGDILSIDMEKVMSLALLLITVLVFWFFFFNKLNSITLSAALSHSRGIHTELMDNIFVVIMAVVVMLCIKWLGILIINAMLIRPAAAARTISSNIREYTLFSLIFAVYSGISGLIISYYASVATGPMIVVISAVIYFITLLAKRKLSVK
jgi:zinc transport system permease protein